MEPVREAILYRYRAVPYDPNSLYDIEAVMSEPWEFLTIENGYWIFKAENKGMAIPANREMMDESIKEAKLRAVGNTKLKPGIREEIYDDEVQAKYE